MSGISFVFDPDQPGGSRVVKDSVKLQSGLPLEMEKVRSYNCSQHAFIPIRTGDVKFSWFLRCPFSLIHVTPFSGKPLYLKKIMSPLI